MVRGTSSSETALANEAAKEGKLAVLPAYSSVENHLELGVLDGLTEIRSFLRQL